MRESAPALTCAAQDSPTRLGPSCFCNVYRTPTRLGPSWLRWLSRRMPQVAGRYGSTSRLLPATAAVQCRLRHAAVRNCHHDECRQRLLETVAPRFEQFVVRSDCDRRTVRSDTDTRRSSIIAVQQAWVSQCCDMCNLAVCSRLHDACAVCIEAAYFTHTLHCASYAHGSSDGASAARA